jgi:hypothetical protein
MTRHPDIDGRPTRNMGAAIRRTSRLTSCRHHAVIASNRFQAMSRSIRLSHAAGWGALTVISQAINLATSPIHAADMVAPAISQVTNQVINQIINQVISKAISSQVTSLIRVAATAM